MDYAVVGFVDDPRVKKNVHKSLIRGKKSKKSFHSRAATDFEKAPSYYQVKWQKSDRSSDGYYDATIIYLAGSALSAQQKAAHFQVKFVGDPLLPEIGPSTSNVLPENEKRMRSTKIDQSDKIQKTVSKSPQKLTSNASKPSKKPASKLTKSISVAASKKSASSKTNETEPNVKKLKVNKLAKDPTTLMHMKEALERAKMNPLATKETSTTSALTKSVAVSPRMSSSGRETSPGPRAKSLEVPEPRVTPKRLFGKDLMNLLGNTAEITVYEHHTSTPVEGNSSDLKTSTPEKDKSRCGSPWKISPMDTFKKDLQSEKDVDCHQVEDNCEFGSGNESESSEAPSKLELLMQPCQNQSTPAKNNEDSGLADSANEETVQVSAHLDYSQNHDDFQSSESDFSLSDDDEDDTVKLMNKIAALKVKYRNIKIAAKISETSRLAQREELLNLKKRCSELAAINVQMKASLSEILKLAAGDANQGHNVGTATGKRKLFLDDFEHDHTGVSPRKKQSVAEKKMTKSAPKKTRWIDNPGVKKVLQELEGMKDPLLDEGIPMPAFQDGFKVGGITMAGRVTNILGQLRNRRLPRTNYTSCLGLCPLC